MSNNIYNQNQINFQELFNKFKINEHYLKKYLKFINYYLNTNKLLSANFDKHHILPKCIFPNYATNFDNIVNLTYREHFIAHWMLTRIFYNENEKLLFAFNTMNNTRNYKNNSKIYEVERKLAYEKIKKININRFINMSNEDKLKEAERNKKHSKTLKNKTSDYWNNVISKRNITNSKKTDYELQNTNLKKSQKSKIIWNNMTDDDYYKRCDQQRRIMIEYYKNVSTEDLNIRNKNNSKGQHNLSIMTCPYCGKKSKSRGNMKRYHFDNCLNNPNLTAEEIKNIKSKRYEHSIKMNKYKYA